MDAQPNAAAAAPLQIEQPPVDEDAPPNNEAEMLQREVAAAKNLFIAGFFLLPFIWLLNAVYYWKATSPLLQWYVRASWRLFLVAMSAWIAWLVVFYSSLDSDWARRILVVSID